MPVLLPTVAVLFKALILPKLIGPLTVDHEPVEPLAGAMAAKVKTLFWH